MKTLLTQKSSIDIETLKKTNILNRTEIFSMSLRSITTDLMDLFAPSTDFPQEFFLNVFEFRLIFYKAIS